jgi:hypothetical protein
VKDFLGFYKALADGERIDRLFERNKVLLHYFGEREESSPIYPGPINNFELVTFKPQIYDSEEVYTNVILKKGVKENSDYIYVSEEEWKLLKEMFGYNFEIERLKETLHDEVLIEVNLRRFKVLILSANIQKNDIFPKNIQISKTKDIKDLKKKIFRCLEGKISEKAKFYIFPFGLKDRKNELFHLVYGYTNDMKKMKTEVSLIEESGSIEVIN